MPGHDIVVIGASAGGIGALRQIVAELPPEYSGSIFVVLHIPPDAPSVLASILGRAGYLPTVTAHDGDAIVPGRIVVAIPDHHLMLKDGGIRVVRGPRENMHRPAIDVLFRSAARYYGPRVVAVLLSGMRADGVSGLIAVRRMGGTVLVQEPTDAMFPALPEAGIAMDSPDRVLPAAEIGPELVRLLDVPAGDKRPVPVDVEKELRFAQGAAGPEDTPPGESSKFACPDCNGSLWETKEGQLMRYRCRVGHSFTEESLVTSKADQLENALWAALRSLEESAAIEKRAAERVGASQHTFSTQRLRESSATKANHARMIRDMLLRITEEPQVETGGSTSAAESGTAD